MNSTNKGYTAEEKNGRLIVTKNGKTLRRPLLRYNGKYKANLSKVYDALFATAIPPKDAAKIETLLSMALYTGDYTDVDAKIDEVRRTYLGDTSEEAPALPASSGNVSSVSPTAAAAATPVQETRKLPWHERRNWERRMYNLPDDWEEQLAELERERKEKEAAWLAANPPPPGWWNRTKGAVSKLFEPFPENNDNSNVPYRGGKAHKKTRKASKKSRKGKSRKH